VILPRADQTDCHALVTPWSDQGVTGRLREDGRVTPAVKMLESAGVEHAISEYDRHLSGDGALRDFGREAAEALGLSDDEVFKTLIVVVEGGPRSPEMVVAVLPVSCQLSMKLIAVAAGAKKATMCDPAAAERSSGYVIGGISPLGQRRQLRTVVDESAQLFDMIYVSGGKRGLDIGLAPGDLISVLHATVALITA
jgi:Cys-tRNA(Pro)/Cys-tRNA(Cys) deacylase